MEQRLHAQYSNTHGCYRPWAHGERARACKR